MAQRTTESIATVMVKPRHGAGMFLTPVAGPAGYRMLVRRSYETMHESTAQKSRLPRRNAPSLDDELAAWDLASDLALEGFEESLEPL